MSETKRAFAVQRANDGTVWAFGEGDLTDTVPTRGFLKGSKIANPTITLDRGGVVYGFECWWGPESGKDKFIAGREVVYVDAPTGEDG